MEIGVEIGTATKADVILTAAERLFAEKGFHAATMREVAEAAGVGLSLLVYHFTNKETLYRRIFERRQYVNEDRLARLAAVPDEPAVPGALEALVAALIDPVLELHDDPDGMWFARLVLREAADPSSHERGVIGELFDPMAKVFVAKLEALLPDQPPGFHAWAYLFSVGALTQSSFDLRLDRISRPGLPRRKNEFLHRYLVAALRGA